MIAMENKLLEELKKKLESGDISQELYDEILARWSGSSASDPDKSAEPETGKHGTTSISGAGNLSSVQSESLRIAGAGQVSGDVDVEDMSISGSAKVQGTITVSDSLESSGSLVAEKSITAGSIDSSGSLRAGSIKADQIDSSGALRVNGNIEAGEMDISGKCVAENIITESMDCSGSIEVKSLIGKEIEISGSIKAELVECESFEMSVDSPGHKSSIEKLKSGEVKVEAGRRFFRGTIDIREIECNTAYLESVKAEKIKGHEVVIGDGCEVDYVEASVIKTSGDAVVRNKNIV